MGGGSVDLTVVVGVLVVGSVVGIRVVGRKVVRVGVNGQVFVVPDIGACVDEGDGLGVGEADGLVGNVRIGEEVANGELSDDVLPLPT